MRKTKLENGMVAIIEENHSVPVVAIQIWVKVGSGLETDEEAGLSHFFEHMLFKGTSRRGLGEIAKEIEASGGYINAYTSFEETVYHVVLASRFFDTGLDILADAIQNSSFPVEEVEKEKKVILEEIKRGLDTPQRKLTQDLFALAYPDHSFGRPIAGYEKTVKGFNRADLVKFYQKWYVPDNMVVVVVGDVDARKALSNIKAAFGKLRPSKSARIGAFAEVARTRMKTRVLKEEIKESYLEMAFNIPGLLHPAAYTAEILSVILGQGDSSRLNQRVKDELGLVHSINSSCFVPKGPGLITFGATLDEGCALKALRSIMLEIDRLKKEEVSEAELNKAKINIEGDFIFEKETVQGCARTQGFFEAILGDAFFEKEYLMRISEVSAEDIRRFAQQYLVSPNLSVALMLPKSSATTIGKAELARVCSAVESRRTVVGRATLSRRPNGPLVKRELENGLKLIVKENHLAPVVAVKAAMLGGLRFESRGDNGISNFVAHMLTKGTASRSAMDIAKSVESMGGAIEGFSGRNSLGVSSELMSRYFEQGLEITSDVLLNSTFDPAETEKKRVEILALIKELSDDPSHLAFSKTLGSLFKVSPYGMDVNGTAEAVKKLGAEQLAEYYRRCCDPHNMVVAIVGDVKAGEVAARAEKYFGLFKKSGFRAHPVPQEPPVTEKRTVRIYKEKQQAHVVMAFMGTSMKSPDRYALRVMNSILSGQAGRLFMEIRDRGGLAYSVSSFTWEGIDPGYIAVYAGVSPEKVDFAIDSIKKELRRLRDERVGREEIERAKKFIVGNFEISLQRNIAQASNIAFNELYGLGFDYHKKYPRGIMKVTVEDVLDVANKYLALDRCVVGVLKPKAERKMHGREVALTTARARRGKKK